MPNQLLARAGAIFFLLWGAAHVIGAISILATGYATYQDGAGEFAPLAQSILSYFAYLIGGIGFAVIAVAVRLNWRNSHLGLALNTCIVGFTDLGLVIFLAAPGHVAWSEAAIGLGLFGLALVTATPACRHMLAEHG